LRIKIRLQPKAKREKIIMSQNELKIYVTVPPVDNKANRACIGVLASFFKVPKSNITLVHGARSKEKIFDIKGLDEHTFRERLSELKK